MRLQPSLKSFAQVTALVALLLISILVPPFIHTNHTQPVMAAMMSKAKNSTNCLTACTSSRSSTQVNSLQRNLEEREQEPAPEPAEPDYLVFMGVGWTTVIIFAAAYLIKYLHWRPPDLYKLNVAYRF